MKTLALIRPGGRFRIFKPGNTYLLTEDAIGKIKERLQHLVVRQPLSFSV